MKTVLKKQQLYQQWQQTWVTLSHKTTKVYTDINLYITQVEHLCKSKKKKNTRKRIHSHYPITSHVSRAITNHRGIHTRAWVSIWILWILLQSTVHCRYFSSACERGNRYGTFPFRNKCVGFIYMLMLFRILIFCL